MKDQEIIEQLIKLNNKVTTTNHWLVAIYVIIIVIGIIFIMLK
jgi:hypothetical protein